MPSVGMRRTTRVFGTRILRSGKRLWTGRNNSGEWVELQDNSGDGTQRKEPGERGHGLGTEQGAARMDVDEEVVELIAENASHLVPFVSNDCDANRRWGIIYSRKRRRVDWDVESSSVGNPMRFGKQFFRKKLRRKSDSNLRMMSGGSYNSLGLSDSSLSLMASGGSYDNSKLRNLVVVVDPSICSWNLVSSILSSILRYMWSARVGLQQLSAIISMESIVSAFSSCGICFLKGPKLIGRGSCMIWYANTSIPMFQVDYSTAPCCFMYLNLKRVLEFDRLFCSIGQHLVDMIGRDDGMALSCMHPAMSNAIETSDMVALAPNDDSKKIAVSVMIEEPNSGQNVHIEGIRNRNRSSRSKQSRQPSSLGVRTSSRASPSSRKSLRNNGSQASSVTGRHGLRSSATRTGEANMNVVKNTNIVKSVSEGLRSATRTGAANLNVVKNTKIVKSVSEGLRSTNRTGAANVNVVKNTKIVKSVSEGLRSSTRTRAAGMNIFKNTILMESVSELGSVTRTRAAHLNVVKNTKLAKTVPEEGLKPEVDSTRSSAVRTGAAHMNVARNTKHVKSVSEGLKTEVGSTGAAPMNAVKNTNHVKLVSDILKSEVDLTSCSSNVLVLGSEKCYRIAGARISLEASVEKQWNLVIKKDGMDPYFLVAQPYMRPSSKNRVTNAVVWNTDNNWKLEFPDRQDWLIFKELYKKCSLLNVPTPQNPVENFIPIPGVREVSDYVSSTHTFRRPASYISMKDDELSRALAGKTASYDIDSEDELWLNNLNEEVGEDHKPLSAEDFELAIENLEKTFHCNPDAFSDERIPQIEFSLERRVFEAVHGYWSNKRKQRRSALIKVFQLYQPRRTHLIPNAILRKKRSFKRNVSSVGTGKLQPFLEAMEAERNAREKQNAMMKVEEAKAAASRAEEVAIMKRQRAQKLMEAADLAMYKATMAVRAAEMAQKHPAPAAPDAKVE